MTQPPVQQGQKKRVKIYTVHGTFDNEASWDNWDDADNAQKPAKKRHFINRLGSRLSEQNVTLEKEDHTEYNWSGGNSHDERRIAAIGLKRKIEDDLSASIDKHGKNHYDGGVFVIGHSHGGTVARLAMNLWDKSHEYHLPANTTEHGKELKHDDQCPVCMRTRDAKFGPNMVAKPDGIITFGSPFVHFKKRNMGLLSARIFIWVVRCLALIPLVAFYLAFSADDAPGFFQSFKTPYIGDALTLLWPLLVFWVVAVYLPRLLLRPMQGNPKKENLFRVLSATSWIVFLGGLLFLGVYYTGYFTGDGWSGVLELLPILGNTTFWFLLPLFLYALFAVVIPGRLLSWMNGQVEGLRDKLPKKYDPREDDATPTTYLCYHTPGDEAGTGLHIFGFMTWLIQTLTLSASVVLAFGLALAIFLVIELLMNWGAGFSLLGAVGISPDTHTDNFIAVMNALTYFPVLVCNWLFWWIPGVELPYLADLQNQDTIAKGIPLALGLSIVLMLFGLMPFILAAIALAYVVSMWLRGSGLVFGSEQFAWTIANKISASSRANTNTNIRTVFVTPEAWWNMEIAHCFYYKSDHVIKDVAENIANWRNVTPNRAWPFVSIIGRVAQWLVVALFVLSIFAVAVSVADQTVNSKQTNESGNASGATVSNGEN